MFAYTFWIWKFKTIKRLNIFQNLYKNLVFFSYETVICYEYIWRVTCQPSTLYLRVQRKGWCNEPLLALASDVLWKIRWVNLANLKCWKGLDTISPLLKALNLLSNNSNYVISFQFLCFWTKYIIIVRLNWCNERP